MDQRSRKGISRRSFFRSAAAVGTGLVLSPHASGQTASAPAGTVNVALLGSGTQGQELLNCCLKIPNIRFQAICDIWTEYNRDRTSKLLATYGHDHNAYVDYRAMLDKEKVLDAVIIATPDFCHAEQTVACLQAGLHVYCETPMSNTIEAAGKMVRAAKQTGRLLQIGHQRRSNPRYIHCGENLLGEVRLLGRIIAVSGQWNQPSEPDKGWPRRAPVDEATLKQYGFDSMQRFKNWRWYRGLGSGPAVEFGSQQVDVFNWFLNARPKSVIASGGTDYYDKKTHEWYDTVMVIYDYETRRGTARAFYQTVTANSSYGNFERFLGDEGTLQISETSPNTKIYREPSVPRWAKWVNLGYLEQPSEKKTPLSETSVEVTESVEPPAYRLPIKFDDPNHKPHLENFFDAIRGETRLNCPAEVAYETAVAVLKVNDAIESGRKVSLGPEDFRA
jgi:predicted dehydrogenase